MKKYKNNEAIYRILTMIDYHYEQGTNPDFLNDRVLKNLEISSTRLNLILSELVSAGYVKGKPVYGSTFTNDVVDYLYPHLTISGMNYLVENSAMRRALRSLGPAADFVSLVKG